MIQALRSTEARRTSTNYEDIDITVNPESVEFKCGETGATHISAPLIFRIVDAAGRNRMEGFAKVDY